MRVSVVRERGCGIRSGARRQPFGRHPFERCRIHAHPPDVLHLVEDCLQVQGGPFRIPLKPQQARLLHVSTAGAGPSQGSRRRPVCRRATRCRNRSPSWGAGPWRKSAHPDAEQSRSRRLRAESPAPARAAPRRHSARPHRYRSSSPARKRIWEPSADHNGYLPKDVNCRSAPPSVGTTNRPPPSRSERKTMLLPSGDQSGCDSCAGDFVNCLASPPSSDCTQMSKLPARSDA